MTLVPPLIALSIVSLLTQCSSMGANILLVVFLKENMLIPFSLNSLRNALLKIVIWPFCQFQVETIAFTI